MPRRICYYLVATHMGGAERSIVDLAEQIKANAHYGFVPWVVVPKAEGPLVDRLARSGIGFDVLPMPDGIFRLSRHASAKGSQLIPTALSALASVPAAVSYVRTFASLIRRKQASLVHSNAIKCHVFSALAKPGYRVPLVWHLRDIVEAGPMLTGLRILRGLSHAHVIANSRATGMAFDKTSGDNLSVIHNGLDPQVYVNKGHNVLRSRLGIPNGAPLVGIVGVLARWKGQLEFLTMAKAMIDRGSEAHFAIIGDGIYDTSGERGFKRELLDLVASLGIVGRLHFAGFVDDPVTAISGLDVLVHASIKPEPFGRVIVEAMACGTPVVAFVSGGVAELLEHGRTGILCKLGDVEKLASEVERILGDTALAGLLAKNAEEAFKSRFTLERHVADVVGVYARLLGTARGRSVSSLSA